MSEIYTGMATTSTPLLIRQNMEEHTLDQEYQYWILHLCFKLLILLNRLGVDFGFEIFKLLCAGCCEKVIITTYKYLIFFSLE